MLPFKDQGHFQNFPFIVEIKFNFRVKKTLSWINHKTFIVIYNFSSKKFRLQTNSASSEHFLNFSTALNDSRVPFTFRKMSTRRRNEALFVDICEQHKIGCCMSLLNLVFKVIWWYLDQNQCFHDRPTSLEMRTFKND